MVELSERSEEKLKRKNEPDVNMVRILGFERKKGWTNDLKVAMLRNTLARISLSCFYWLFTSKKQNKTKNMKTNQRPRENNS